MKSKKLAPLERISAQELQEVRQMIDEVYGVDSKEASLFKKRFIPTTQIDSLFFGEKTLQKTLQKKISSPTREELKLFLSELANPDGTPSIAHRVHQDGELMREPRLILLHLELKRFIEENTSSAWREALLNYSGNALDAPGREDLIDHLTTQPLESDLIVTDFSVAAQLAEAAINRFRISNGEAALH